MRVTHRSGFGTTIADKSDCCAAAFITGLRYGVEGSTPRMLATRSDRLNGTVLALRCCLNLGASVATRSV